MPRFQHAIAISAPPERVWGILVDVERCARGRGEDPPRAAQAPRGCLDGHRLTSGTAFTWTSTSPGVRVTASHLVEQSPEGSRLTLAVDLAGWLAPVGWLMTRSLTQPYVETEAASIKAAAEAG